MDDFQRRGARLDVVSGEESEMREIDQMPPEGVFVTSRAKQLQSLRSQPTRFIVVAFADGLMRETGERRALTPELAAFDRSGPRGNGESGSLGDFAGVEGRERLPAERQ